LNRPSVTKITRRDRNTVLFIALKLDDTAPSNVLYFRPLFIGAGMGLRLVIKQYALQVGYGYTLLYIGISR
jgi:hypothetical protein